MSTSQINRMKELTEQLAEAAYVYEQQNTEILTNYEYDKLYDELQNLEQETGIVLAGSVTQKVGYEAVSNLPKVMHTQRMLSLDKTKEIDKLKSFLGDKEGVLSWKLDGLTIVCTYEKGELVRAVTRGNGTIGEEITNNAKTFRNLPLKIDYKGLLIIRGEALITYSDFFRINEKLGEKEEKYKNPRNLCSGSVRQLNSKITADRNVRFYAFAIVEGGENFKTKTEQLEWLSLKGFESVEYKKVSQAILEAQVNYFSQEISKRDFASDGLVLTYNDILYSKSLGETSKFPKDSIAFKWQDELALTQVITIEWNTSRTGLINPVAVFEPVEIEGTTVERASVHNLSILEELKLGIGDTIKVYKANMIIPQVSENISRTGPVPIPLECPVCGGDTLIKQEKASKTLYCTNANCKAQRLRAFAHFTSRDAMNIEGLSEATINKFLEKGYLKELSSFYHLEQFQQEIIKMEGFGQKSYDNLIYSIEKSRTVDLVHFIYALGILQVGLNTAKLICKYFNNDIHSMMSAKEEDLLLVAGIGPVIAKAFSFYFSLEENQKIIYNLLKEVHLKEEKIETFETSPIQNQIFVITGEVYHFNNRKELQAKIEQLGGKVTGSVSKNTNYLINNDNTSSSSKNKKAQALHIPIITEEDFLKLISQGL